MPRDLDRLYRALGWDSRPRGSRFLESYRVFRKLLSMPPLESLARKRAVSILDACSGSGIGGFALAKALRDLGVEAEVVLLDARAQPLTEAKSFSATPLVDGVAADARLVPSRSRAFDACLVWGYSMPHFNPFEVHKLFSSITRVLKSDGCLLIEEVDRFLSIFAGTGYQYVWPEQGGGLAISIHRGYDPSTSVVRRALVDLRSGEAIDHEAFLLWTPALVAAFLHPYFARIELFLLSEGAKGVVVACNPRKAFNPVEDGPRATPLARALWY